MNALMSVLLLAAVSADPADVPQVRGLLITHLGFDEKDREKLAATAITLLASCSSSCPSKEEDFEKIFRQCQPARQVLQIAGGDGETFAEGEGR